MLFNAVLPVREVIFLCSFLPNLYIYIYIYISIYIHKYIYTYIYVYIYIYIYIYCIYIYIYIYNIYAIMKTTCFPGITINNGFIANHALVNKYIKCRYIICPSASVATKPVQWRGDAYLASVRFEHSVPLVTYNHI